MKPYAAPLSALALALLVLTAPAGAVDDTKPVFDPTSTCGKFAKDSESDQTDPSGEAIPQAEILNGFVKYDAAKGAEATTLNLTIKQLDESVPPPATSMTYDAIYNSTIFVRAYMDFAGMTTYEYGHTEPLAVSTRYAYDGTTTGKLFPGEKGVVQIVIPAEAGGKVGSSLTGVTGEVQVGRTAIVPGAITQSPTRGLSFQNDEVGIGTFKIGPCAPGAAPGTTPGTPTTTAPQTVQGSAPKVKLLTKSVKKAKKGKSVAFKFSTSAPLKSVALRLAKGKKVFGTGKATTFSGTKTLKVKLSKALAKGTYQLAFAGTDDAGRRTIGTFNVKVK